MASGKMPSDEKPTSIWKKEMSFRRKPADESAPDGSAEPESPSGSIWKKEISLRKKAKDAPAEPEVVVEPEPPLEAEPQLEVEPQLEADQQSLVQLEPVAIAAPEPVHEPVGGGQEPARRDLAAVRLHHREAVRVLPGQPPEPQIGHGRRG